MSIVIFLNGCGSAGKTSISTAIQNCSDQPWLLFDLDTFIDMLPEKYMIYGSKAKEGYFSFVQSANDRGATINIKIGPLYDQFFDTMPSIAKLLADQGNNLIIDEVLYGDKKVEAYADQLKSHTVYFIGVFCDLATLQSRETQRGDREIGLSNDQFDRVHAGRRYDLNVDTTHNSPKDIATEILSFISLSSPSSP